MFTKLLCHFASVFVILHVSDSEKRKPNVLFIVVDDLRPNLGVYNYKNAYTPNIDKLADKSFVFTNAYAQQALCAPSRNSFLTSRRPDTLRLYDFYSYWRDTVGNFSTLPQHFKENGYRTHSIGKIFHPGRSSNGTDDAAYSWSETPYHPSTEAYKESMVCVTANDTKAANLMCPVVLSEQPEGTLPDIQSVDAAIEFLRRRDNAIEPRSYFLAVGLHKPHVPFKYPVEYLDHHPLDNVVLSPYLQRPPKLPTVAWNPWTDVRRRADIALLNVSFPFGPMPVDVTRRIVQNYDASVTYVDDLIGKLMVHVDDDAIVVLIGDHGWSLGEHGEFSKFSNYDVSTRVPFVLRVPAVSERQVIVEEPVELVDLFPTLVDSTKISAPLKRCKGRKLMLCTEGKSLMPLMISKMINLPDFKYDGAAFSQYPRPGNYPTLKPNSDKPRLKEIKIMGYSIRTDRYRYTEWIAFDSIRFVANWSIVYGRELYDRTVDGGEETLNLADRPQLNYTMMMLREKLIANHLVTL